MRMRALFMGILLVWASSLCFSEYVVQFDHDSKIVFSSNFEGNEEIYLLTRNQLTRLTDDPATDEWPVPDSKGESIVFSSDRSGNYDLYLMNLESREIKRLTTDTRDERAPSWSVDDRFIYYDLNVKGERWRTMKVDVRIGTTTPLFPDPPYSTTIVAFESPNGNEIFFTGKTFLGWLVAKFDKVRGTYMEVAKKGSCRAKVSPDGSLVTYVAHDDDGLGDVFVMAPDGSAKRNLTRSRSRTHDYYPCFSPDGKMIVFSSSPKGKGKNSYQLHTLDLGSGEVKNILTTSGNDRFPYWFK